VKESIDIVTDNSLFKYLEKFSNEFYLLLKNCNMIYHYPMDKEIIEKDIINHKKRYCLFVYEKGLFDKDRILIHFFYNKNEAEEHIDSYIPFRSEVLEFEQ